MYRENYFFKFIFTKVTKPLAVALLIKYLLVYDS